MSVQYKCCTHKSGGIKLGSVRTDPYQLLESIWLRSQKDKYKTII